MKAAALLIVTAALCSAHKQSEAEKTSRSCSNLTLLLDNWKYAIMTQVKDLLLHDHSSVLPDYSRIQPLSGALADLYQEFNGLKEQLAQLTARFGGVERFVERLRSGRKGARPPGPAGGGAERRRVVIRRVKKPGSQDGGS